MRNKPIILESVFDEFALNINTKGNPSYKFQSSSISLRETIVSSLMASKNNDVNKVDEDKLMQLLDLVKDVL